ncbi:MAG: rhodanese-like domain-containing protein [Gammaproteobacteria bacterium]|nr:rhodanese-like domain-containing protein [Gammaproteobacteria bacterium]
MLAQILSCQDARSVLNQGGQLVDVRTPSEHQQFALPGSTNLPLQEIGSASNKLDKNKPVMVYCQSGARSEQAKYFLNSMGFNQVYNLGSVQNYYNC